MQILIPAYKSGGTLLRAINSILSQKSVPNLSIKVVDDSGDDSMDLELKQVILNCEGRVNLTVERNKRNIGPFRNIFQLLAAASEEVIMLMPHDDYIVDSSFLMRSLSEFEDSSVGVVIANSLVEHSLKTSMNYFDSGFVRVPGNSYIAGPLWNHLHPAYSAVMLRRTLVSTAEMMDLFWGTLRVEELSGAGIALDEGFLTMILIARRSNVSMSGRVVSVRGNAPGTYSKSDEWRRGYSENMIATYFNLWGYGERVGDNLLCRIAVYLLKTRFRDSINLSSTRVGFFSRDPNSYKRYLSEVLV